MAVGGADPVAMAREVERKFLVRDGGWKASVVEALVIRQFYLAALPGRSIRVRVTDAARAMLTLKFGGETRIRDEFEYEIPLRDAEAMENFAVGRVIEKSRHIVRHHELIFEVDVFAGELSGLVLAELETDDPVTDDALPAWLGREVTGDPAYYNATLALRAPGPGQRAVAS
jgi:CYTH domain-containing protein